LEEGMIEGALVTRMKEDKPLEPEPFIARTREEIIDASRSKYCPVPANIALREILDSKKGESFAVVGLPCHLHGIRKARQVDKNLERRIVLHLGILCGHSPNFWATESLLRRMKVKKKEVIKLDYRGEGWPGSMTICLRDGQTQTILYRDYRSFMSSGFFTPTRCLMCSDQSAELADVSFGDAWLPEFKGDKAGWSMIISRTRLGEQLLERTRAKGCVELDRVTVNEAKRSQLGRLYFKKKVVKARLRLFRRKPLFKTSLLEPSLVDYPLSLFPYVNHRLSQNRPLRLLLGKVSMKLLRLYRMPYSVIYSRGSRRFRNRLLEPVPEKQAKENCDN
jgi:coenzyme F420 hydrogenase subunit beta